MLTTFDVGQRVRVRAEAQGADGHYANATGRVLWQGREGGYVRVLLDDEHWLEWAGQRDLVTGRAWLLFHSENLEVS